MSVITKPLIGGSALIGGATITAHQLTKTKEASVETTQTKSTEGAPKS